VISSELAEYAESPSVFSVWPDGFRRVLEERYCLVLGPSPYFSEVQRPRLGDTVEKTVAEIRALARSSDHVPPVWWIGGSATPDDLVERLRALGLEEPPANAELVALAIAAEPDAGPAAVETRTVETLEDYAAARELMWDVFETPEERREDERLRIDEAFRAERELGAVVGFLALLDGEPIAAGRAAYSERGGLLFGGCTVPRARGRGAYRALVRARWEEAVRRGTPALVTQAAPTSEPILRRLGFEEVTRVRRLVDPGG